MKKVMLLVAAICAFSMTGCVATEEDFEPELSEPRSYTEAMDWIRDEVELIDKHVIGGEYASAVRETQRVVDWSESLGRFEPPRMPQDWQAYEEFDKQTEDLHHAADRLLYFLEQRRKLDAQEQLGEFAIRYNRLSVDYGPNYQISVLERDPNEFRVEPIDRSEVPGELSGNR
jgi:hypothetical protein